MSKPIPEIRWKTERFAEYGLLMKEAASKGVRSLAAGVLYHAIENIRINKTIDTGAMRASMYMQVGEDETGRQLAIANARGRNVEAGLGIVAFEPESDLEAKVACGVEYGIYIEFGTKRMGAKPFLGPAFDLIASQQEDIYQRICKEYLGKK